MITDIDAGNNNNIDPENIAEPSTFKPKKRFLNKEDWPVNQRKLLRNSGKEYKTKMGVIKHEKRFSNLFCGCPKNCSVLFSANERLEIFTSFWNLQSFNFQNAYLYALVQKHVVNRKRPVDRSRQGKNFTYKYFLKSGNQTNSVCKRYFLETFAINHGRLYRCLSKPDVSESIDKRGTTGSRKLDDSNIVAHIQRFPAYLDLQYAKCGSFIKKIVKSK